MKNTNTVTIDGLKVVDSETILQGVSIYYLKNEKGNNFRIMVNQYDMSIFTPWGNNFHVKRGAWTKVQYGFQLTVEPTDLRMINEIIKVVDIEVDISTLGY